MFFCHLESAKPYFMAFGETRSRGKVALKICLNPQCEVVVIDKLPIAIEHWSATAVLNGSMFFVGIGEDCDEIWQYNVRDSLWLMCTYFAKGRMWHSVAFIQQVLCICGGLSVQCPCNVIDTIEGYDTAQNEISIVGKLTYGVMRAGNCLVYNESLFFFGGRNQNNEELDSIQVYDTRLKCALVLKRRMPKCLASLGSVLYSKFAIVMSNEICFVFDLETTNLSLRDQFKLEVENFGMMAHEDKLFVVGGGGKFPLDAVRCILIFQIMMDAESAWQDQAKVPEDFFVFSTAKLEF